MEFFGNTSGAGGPAGGNFAPSPYEAWEAAMRRNSSSDFMEFAEANNPRTRAIQRAIAAGAVGLNHMDRSSEWLNYSKQGFWMKQASQFLQHSGAYGSGSFTDLAYGLQQGLGNSGASLNMFGGTQMMAGGGASNDIMARMMMNRMNDRFFSQSGFGINSRTLGRDPTEMGRAFQLLSRNGSFAGSELFSFGDKSVKQRLESSAEDLRSNNMIKEANMVRDLINKGGSEGSMLSGTRDLVARSKSLGLDGLTKSLQGGVLDTNKGFVANEDAIKKVGEQMTDFFKLHNAIKDVYGDISDVAAATMGSNLTGLSGAGKDDLKIMRSRIEGYKTQAKALGISQQEMFSLAQNGVEMGAGILGRRFAGQFMYTAAADAAMSQGYSRVPHKAYADQGKWVPTITAEQAMQSNLQDAAGMLGENETRLSLEMQHALLYDKRTAGKAGEIRAAANAMASAGTDGERSAAYRNAIGLMREFGPTNLSNQALLAGITNSPEGKAFSDSLNMQIQRITKGRSFNSKAIELAGKGYKGFGKDGGRLMHLLAGTFQQGELDKIFALMESGDIGGVADFVGRNGQTLGMMGSSPEELMGLIKSVSDSVGGSAAAANASEYGITQLRQQGMLNNFVPTQYKYSQEAARAFDAVMKQQISGDPITEKSLLGAVAERIISGGTSSLRTEDVNAYAAAKGMGSTFSYDGSKRKLGMNDNQIAQFAQNEVFMRALGGSKGDTEYLKKILAMDNNASAIQGGLSSADISVFGKKDGSVGYLTTEEYGAAESGLLTDGSRNYYKFLTGNSLLNDAEVSALSTDNASGSVSSEWYDVLKSRSSTEISERFGNSETLAKMIKKSLKFDSRDGAATTLALLKGKTGANIDQKIIDEAYREFASDNKALIKEKTGVEITDEMKKSGEFYKVVDAALAKLAQDKTYADQGGPSSTAAGGSVARMEVTNLYVTGQFKKE